MTHSRPSHAPVRPRLRRPRFVAALAAALLPVSLGLASLPAHAGPDDGKFVATEAHLDSPKVFWNGETFDLKNETNRVDRPLEDTVAYLGKGYGDEGQQWLFTVPADQPSLSFLGAPGTTWFQGPQLPSGLNQQPLWAGFGADTSIPVERFRDAAFTLDIVSATGPGRIEWFDWRRSTASDYLPVVRLFSTSDAIAQSQLLHPGSHEHLATVFSKPGRYEITYRATARAADGTIIASKDTPLVWQIGGARPGTPTPGPAGPAPAERPQAPTFALEPAPADRVDPRDAANAAKLSLGTLDLGPGATGTAELFVNGHHYTDLAIADGRGEFLDFLGEGPNDFQAVFTPSAGAAGTPWTSAPLAYAAGAPKASTSATAPAVAAPVDATLERRLDRATYTPSGPVPYSISLGNGDQPNTVGVKLRIDDPNIAGFLEVLGYEHLGEEYASSTARFWVRGGADFDGLLPYASYMNGLDLVVRFVPHPLVGSSGFTLPILEDYKVGDAKTLTGELVPQERGATTSTAPVPAPTGTPGPTKPADACSGLVLLDRGHIDLASGVLDGDALRMVVKDDTRVKDPASVDRDASEVAILVGEQAATQRDSRTPSPEWDHVLNPAGETSYLLPMRQQDNLPWPGYSTERVDHSRLAGPLTLSLDAVRGPGDVAFFTVDSFGGKPSVLLGSRPGAPRTISINHSTHAHGSWSFTTAGVYELDLRYRGTLLDGTPLDSGVATVKFTVGSAGRAELCGQPHAPVADRIAGGDRYATAAKVSQSAHRYVPSTGVPVVLATGANFPDALAAGPAAAAVGGSLLLTQPDALPAATEAELRRLSPKQVTIVGSASSINSAVEAKIRASVPQARIERVAGADRYATAVAIAERFMPNATTAYLASGANYPDAVAAAAAGAAAARTNGSAIPVLLSTPDRLLAQTSGSGAFRKLTAVNLVGSASTLAASVEDQVKAAVPSAAVSRLAGADRMATSVAVSRSIPGLKPGGAVSIATGWGFADALAASTLAAADGSPVLLATPQCTAGDAVTRVTELAPRRVRMIGRNDRVPDGVHERRCGA